MSIAAIANSSAQEIKIIIRKGFQNKQLLLRQTENKKLNDTSSNSSPPEYVTIAPFQTCLLLTVTSKFT